MAPASQFRIGAFANQKRARTDVVWIHAQILQNSQIRLIEQRERENPFTGFSDTRGEIHNEATDA
jgi:hypothetical protein